MRRQKRPCTNRWRTAADDPQEPHGLLHDPWKELGWTASRCAGRPLLSSWPEAERMDANFPACSMLKGGLPHLSDSRWQCLLYSAPGATCSAFQAEPSLLCNVMHLSSTELGRAGTPRAKMTVVSPPAAGPSTRTAVHALCRYM